MSQRARSPVLGYNHNLRHGGRVFHVQTEDSGLGYARLYTHLFYEGTILSSKKQEYDPSAPEDVVRSAMQKLHKLMIMELTHAEHDARIAAFFTARGEPATLADPAQVGAGAAVPVAQAPSPSPARVEAPAIEPAPAPVVPAPVVPAKVVPKPMVTVQQAAAKHPSVVVSNAADGVVVRRNVVINVGAGQPPVNGTVGKPSAPAPWPARARAGGQYAVREGGGYVAGNRARAITTQEVQPQPLASAREIRMPWETPAPTRIAPPPSAAVQVSAEGGAAVVSTGKLRMPWDVSPAAAPEAFSAELVSDKSLDEVILEYLADDGETDER
jgi:hypothetical protein